MAILKCMEFTGYCGYFGYTAFLKFNCMQESRLERKFVNGVRKAGGAALKLLAPWLTGWPDRTVLMPRGRVWFVELKRPGGKLSRRQLSRRQLSRRQLIVHAWLRVLGFDVRVIDTPELVNDFLKEIAQ